MNSLDDQRAAPIGVFGLGNVLMGDDALGPTVLAGLMAGFDFQIEAYRVDVNAPQRGLARHAAWQASSVVSKMLARSEP